MTASAEANRTRRTLLVAGLGIAALLGGSMGLVFWLTGRAPPAAPPPAPAAVSAPPAAPAPPVAAAPSTPPAPRGGGLARDWWRSSGEDPSAPPMAGRVIRKSVRKALLAAPLQARLARCVRPGGGFGGGAAPDRVPRAKPAVLLLEMEAQEGEVRIVEARVQAWGGASAQAVSCAQSVLRGQVVRASNAVPGQRLRMTFPLNARGYALAAR